MELNNEQVAETLDEIASLFTKLAGSFRAPAGGGKAARNDGKAAGKPAAGKRAPTKVEEGDDEVTVDMVREKLKELTVAKGKDKMVEALESVGAGRLADVDESQYQELIDKAQEMIDAEDEAEDDAPKAKKPAAKKAKKPAVTLDQLTEAAQALMEADKPALVKLVKKYGKVSEADESVYAEYLKAIQDAMPADEDEGLL